MWVGRLYCALFVTTHSVIGVGLAERLEERHASPEGCESPLLVYSTITKSSRVYTAPGAACLPVSIAHATLMAWPADMQTPPVILSSSSP